MPATLPVSYTSVQLVWDQAPWINSISELSSSVLASRYLGPVEAEINAKLAKRFALPLTDRECPILTAVATREAIYNIMITRGLIHFPPAQQGRHPMFVQHLADQNLINAIVTGSMALIDASFTEVPANVAAVELWSTTMDHLPTFGKGDLLDNIQDDAMLDDSRDDYDTKLGS